MSTVTDTTRHPLVEMDDTNNGHLQHIHACWRQGLAFLSPTPQQLEHGLALHQQATALDTFGFLPGVMTQRVVDELNRLTDGSVGSRDWHFRAMGIRRNVIAQDPQGVGGRTFVAALRASGLKGMVLTVGRAAVPAYNDLEREMAVIASYQYMADQFRSDLFQAKSVAQLREGMAQGRFGLVWSMNSPPLPQRMIDPDDEYSWLLPFYQFGFRVCHVGYNRRNMVADGGVENDSGLSMFGRELVGKLNEVGYLVDTPHSGPATTLQTAEVSSKPMAATHVGCKAIYDHHRNKSDEELRAIAQTGGLIGIVGLPGFLGDEANICTLLDHLDHAVNVAGTDHVAIGTDTSSQSPWPADVRRPPAGLFNYRWSGGWKQPSNAKRCERGAGSLAWTNWPLFTVGMVQRGYSDDAIRKILGLNLMRVLEQVEPGPIDAGPMAASMPAT